MSEKSRKGFAAMDPARQREIASRGGRAAHARGTAHVWCARAASEAGKKGGRAVGADREYMSQIGREGGRVRRLAAEAAREAARADRRNLTSAIDHIPPSLEQPRMA